MNIVFYKNNGILPEMGGISRITYNLSRIFRERGNNVWFIASKNTVKDKDYDACQVFLPDQSTVLSQKNVSFLSSFILENKIDIIINQFCSQKEHVELLNRCGRKTGVKIVFCFHNSILTPIYNYPYTRQFTPSKKNSPLLFKLLNNSIVRKVIIWLWILIHRSNYRNIINKNDAIVLLCEGQELELQRASGMRQNKKTWVIYNSMPDQPEVNIERKKHVLWVGNFDYKVKRPDNMLRIWKKIEEKGTDWTLYMLGDGASLQHCKKIATEFGLRNVVFTGRTDPSQYYREAEILCSTSVHECFPMVLLEGMNNGLALVAFDSFTSAELLVEECDNGKLVNAFDINEYAKKLMEIMLDVEERHRLQKNSYISADRFSEDRVYSKWSRILNEI